MRKEQKKFIEKKIRKNLMMIRNSICMMGSAATTKPVLIISTGKSLKDLAQFKATHILDISICFVDLEQVHSPQFIFSFIYSDTRVE
jgi:hypothetical protein